LPGNYRSDHGRNYAHRHRLADHASRYINANYGHNPDLAARRLATLPASRTAVEEAIKRQADMGVDEFILRPCADDLDQLDQLAEIAAGC
jgi:hypothetical protein